jgi:hypothetical protein
MSSPWFDAASGLETEIVKIKAVSDLLWANGQSLEQDTLSSIGLLLGDHLEKLVTVHTTTYGVIMFLYTP